MTDAISTSRNELRDWLRNRVSFYLDRPPAKIDTTAELSRYGMDSVYAISLISDIEDHLELEVDLALVRQCTTIDTLADYLLQLEVGL